MFWVFSFYLYIILVNAFQVLLKEELFFWSHSVCRRDATVIRGKQGFRLISSRCYRYRHKANLKDEMTRVRPSPNLFTILSPSCSIYQTRAHLTNSVCFAFTSRPVKISSSVKSSILLILYVFSAFFFLAKFYFFCQTLNSINLTLNFFFISSSYIFL